MQSNRLLNLLSSVKQEFEKVESVAANYKNQVGVLEANFKRQYDEMKLLHHTVGELERRHLAVVSAYAAEIHRLRELAGEPVDAPLPTVDLESTPSMLLDNQSDAGSLNFGAIGENMPTALLRNNGTVITLPPTATKPTSKKSSRQNHNMKTKKRSNDDQWTAQYIPRSSDNVADIANETSFMSADEALEQSTLTLPIVSAGCSIPHDSVVCAMALNSDGSTLATGCNRAIKIFNADTGATINEFELSTPASTPSGDLYVRSVAFSADSTKLAAAAENKAIEVWDVATRESLHIFSGHTMDIYSVEWSSDGKFLVSGSGDKTARIWSWETKECLREIGGMDAAQDGVTSVAISPDSSILAVASLDKVIFLWDIETGKKLGAFNGHSDAVYSIAFSPDGKSLLSGSLDSMLRLWDVQALKQSHVLQGHSDYVLSVGYAYNGDWIVSGGKDRTVRLWDTRTAKQHAVIRGHGNSVISIATTPSMQRFASGGGDGRARVWTFDEQ